MLNVPILSHRTLTGEPAGIQHLVELTITAEGEVRGMVGQTLLLVLGGRLTIRMGQSVEGWLEANQFAWLQADEAITLDAGATDGPADLLVWRFVLETLPEPMHAMLPAAKGGWIREVSPLTPSMQTLVLALRSCPVAPALRGLWGTGKLIELLTLLLPTPPGDGAGGEGGGLASGDSLAARAAKVLHPAIRAAINFMNLHKGDSIGLPEIAAAAHSSPSHLSRLFTAEFGYGPTEHLRRLRLDHAAALLRSGEVNVTEAAYASGYQSLGQFSRAFSARHGKPPSAFLRRGP